MGCWKNLLLGVAVTALLLFGIPLHVDQTGEVEEQFAKYLQQFNKSYDNETIYQQRFEAFQSSLQAIKKLNAARKHNRSALYGWTKFSDLTPEEFLAAHLQLNLIERKSLRSGASGEHSNRRFHGRTKWSAQNVMKGLPQKMDWREKGVITKVNNQKLCRASWAFSVVQNMEAMYAIKSGKLVPLSVQQLIDCAKNNDGCGGGDACLLLKWMKSYGVKVHAEEAYPLHLKNEQCKTINNTFGVQIDDYACEHLVGSEEYILSTIAHLGPVAVAINALSWQFYVDGVIQFHCEISDKLVNHAVQIVGYDLTAEIPHYIIRNSWGADFGDKGYLYIAIGENLCGLANQISVLTVL